MRWLDHVSQFTTADGIAVAILLIAWIGIGHAIENPPASRPSLSKLTTSFRMDWMQQLVGRDPRVFDAQILSNLRQGTAFFASATMIALGGLMALIGNTEPLEGVARELTLVQAPAIVFEIKLLLVTLFIANAFLKFVWAHRLFGYCAIVMASVPNDKNDPAALPRAKTVGKINITGSRSFNRALRSVYFGLASSAWLLGPAPLAAFALITLFVLWRREFASSSRAALLEQKT